METSRILDRKREKKEESKEMKGRLRKRNMGLIELYIYIYIREGGLEGYTHKWRERTGANNDEKKKKKNEDSV